MVDSAGDIVTELDFPDSGIDTILTMVTLAALPDNVEKLTLLGGALNGTGNALANTIVGNAAANILNGLAGVDTLNGGGGNDTYFINSLGEVLIDSGGIDTVKSLVTKTLGLGFENLTLLGLGNVNGTGNGAANIINGNAGKNTLSGLGSSDVVNGGGGNDVLIGGFGRDTMNGGAGLDRFDFNAPIDSPRGIARDVINGFSRLQHDRIDLSTIDADTSANPGNDVFKFIGTQAFHGGGGEVRFAGGIVQADINGDKIADLEIKVSGLGAMLGTDFIL
jgi:Ca2+-binding RTX toxin-like protein